MRTFTRLALALGLVVCLTGQVRAQGGGRGMGGMMGGPAMYLGNPAVQKELKLSDEQIEKAKAFQTSYQEKQRERMSGLQDLSQEERQEKMAAVRKEMTAEFKKGAAEFLKPEQVKRLDQIVLFNQGANAFGPMGNAEVIEKMKITDDQKAKIKEINDDAGAQRRELMQGMQDDPEGTRKKMTDLTKTTNEKVMALFTSEQKATWKDLTGEPFPVQMQMGGQRRPGGN